MEQYMIIASPVNNDNAVVLAMSDDLPKLQKAVDIISDMPTGYFNEMEDSGAHTKDLLEQLEKLELGINWQDNDDEVPDIDEIFIVEVNRIQIAK